MVNLFELEFDKTVRDFEYTKRSIHKIRKVLDSSSFKNKDAETIFEFLTSKVDIICFGDYLRRYLYEKAQIEEAFTEVPLDVYVEILDDCFRENHVPISFRDSSRRKRIVYRAWLTQDSAKRDAVFLLGFALKMSVEEVTGFLTKVLKEEDFELTDPEECIYWYCYQNELSYLDALRFKELYTRMDNSGAPSTKTWAEMLSDADRFLVDETNFIKHLKHIKVYELEKIQSNLAYEEYMKLYDRARKVIVDIYNDTKKYSRSNWVLEDITPADIEDVLCTGMPRTKNGNLEKVADSKLAKQFASKRMNRQRVINIIKRKRKVQRFDLITLLFFVYAETVEKEWPTERLLQYIDEVNKLLKSCNMMGIYCANPYEIFVLMCLLTEGPLSSYSEVWELSY